MWDDNKSLGNIQDLFSHFDKQEENLQQVYQADKNGNKKILIEKNAWNKNRRHM